MHFSFSFFPLSPNCLVLFHFYFICIISPQLLQFDCAISSSICFVLTKFYSLSCNMEGDIADSEKVSQAKLLACSLTSLSSLHRAIYEYNIHPCFIPFILFLAYISSFCSFDFQHIFVFCSDPSVLLLEFLFIVLSLLLTTSFFFFFLL